MELVTEGETGDDNESQDDGKGKWRRNAGKKEKKKNRGGRELMDANEHQALIVSTTTENMEEENVADSSIAKVPSRSAPTMADSRKRAGKGIAELLSCVLELINKPSVLRNRLEFARELLLIAKDVHKGLDVEEESEFMFQLECVVHDVIRVVRRLYTKDKDHVQVLLRMVDARKYGRELDSVLDYRLVSLLKTKCNALPLRPLNLKEKDDRELVHEICVLSPTLGLSVQENDMDVVELIQFVRDWLGNNMNKLTESQSCLSSSDIEIGCMKLNKKEGLPIMILRGTFHGEPVAIARVNKYALRVSQSSMIAELMSNVEWWRDLHHANIVECLGYSMFTNSNSLCIVMEYCTASLETVLKEMEKQDKRLELKNSMTMLHHITCALEYLHSKFVVHRELDTGNVLFHEPSNHVKLTGFGLLSPPSTLHNFYAADMFDFGALAGTILSATDGGVEHEGMAQLIAACFGKIPHARPSSLELAQAMEEMLETEQLVADENWIQQLMSELKLPRNSINATRTFSYELDVMHACQDAEEIEVVLVGIMDAIRYTDEEYEIYQRARDIEAARKLNPSVADSLDEKDGLKLGLLAKGIFHLLLEVVDEFMENPRIVGTAMDCFWQLGRILEGVLERLESFLRMGLLDRVKLAFHIHENDPYVTAKVFGVVWILAFGSGEICKKLIQENILEKILVGLDRFVLDTETQTNGAACILNLAYQEEELCQYLVDHGVIRPLLRAIETHSTDPSVNRRAVGALRNLIHGSDERKRVLQQHGGLRVLIEALHIQNEPRAIEQLCGALWSLTHLSEEMRQTFVDQGCLGDVFRAMDANLDNEALQETTCGLLSNIAFASEARKQQIMGDGGVERVFVAMRIHRGEEWVQTQALAALWNVAVPSSERKQVMIDMGVYELMLTAMRLYPDSSSLLECAFGLITSLSWTEALLRNAKVVYMPEIVEHIIRGLSRFHDEERLIEQGCWSLQNLTRHISAIRFTVIELGGEQVLNSIICKYHNEPWIVHARQALENTLRLINRNLVLADYIPEEKEHDFIE